MSPHVRLERKNFNVYQEPGFIKRHRKGLLLLAVVFFLALVGLFVAKRIEVKRTKGRLEAFNAALEQKDYDLASSIYRDLQAAVTQKKKGSTTRKELEEIQYKMEDTVRSRVREVLEKVNRGHVLTVEEKEFIEGLKEISAAEVMPLLHKKSEAWLDGVITQGEWEQVIFAFKDLDNLSRLIDDLKRQEEGMARAVSRFRTAEKIEARGNWEYTWKYWQEIVDDPDLAIFARDYATFRLKEYQEREYHNLLSLADRYEEEKRYYSALKLIDKMYGVFPEREELKTRLRELNQRVPQKLDKWLDMVPVLAVRPLVAREDEAFLKGKNTLHAKNNLLTVKEFKRVLEELYRNDFVLIRADLFYDYPEYQPEIIVPRGKKPIILLMEHAAYSTLNQANGTVARLIYDDENDAFMGFYKAMQHEVLEADNTVFGVLEQFVAEHPDFSFDGARGILSLFVMEDILGSIVDEEQLNRVNEARERQALQAYVMDNADFLTEREEVRKKLLALQKHGWELALGGTDDRLFNQLTPSELKSMIDRFRSLIDDSEKKTRILAFPDGALVYNQEAELKAILDEGFNVLVGLGPNPYNFYYPSFVHLDRQTVSPLSLMAAESWGLEDFFDASKIYDRELREQHGK